MQFLVIHERKTYFSTQKKMKHIQIVLAISLLLGCNKMTEDKQAFPLQGAWTLRHVEYPTGSENYYSADGDGTFCHIYDRDSMLYECRVTTSPSGLIIMPTAKCVVTLIDKGDGDFLYLENGDPHPLTICNDTTIMIQSNGALYTWIRADNIYKEWGAEIRNIITKEIAKDNEYEANHYVLSAKERQQEKTIQGFGFFSIFIILVAMIAAHIAVINRKAKRQLQWQLQQIQEVQENRPQSVKQAVATVENHFFASDEYFSLQKRMADGQLLKEKDWDNVEQLLKRVYPGFTSQLRGLHRMSELEYQVCLLIKLRIPPKDIANVLARDVSTISTVRSRLYKKVFGQKGGTKEWDDFILSMGV